MRKYIRKMMRARGEKEHAKPSRVVKYLFNKYQIEKYGIGKRSSNMAHGTHCKKTWNQIIGQRVYRNNGRRYRLIRRIYQRK